MGYSYVSEISTEQSIATVVGKVEAICENCKITRGDQARLCC